MFNEFCIAACTMHMLFFTDWVADLDVRYMYGWSLIVIMCLNIFVNSLFIWYYLIKHTWMVMQKVYKYLKWLWKYLFGKSLIEET